MKCKLCQEKSASKIKSHFISKFLGKDLFEDGYTFQIKNDYTKKKIFDIPKDSFIFCEECENKFSLIETISSRILSNIDKQDNYNNLFQLNYNFGNLILTLNRETKVFNLFFISLIWRASISNHVLFEKFKLPKVKENELRILLNNNLQLEKEKYHNIQNINFKFKYVIIKPVIRNEFTRGHLSTSNPNQYIYMLFLVNFYICFYFKNELIPTPVFQYCNSELNKFSLVLSDNQRWLELNKIALNKIFK
jgi:hypothetical protein